MIYFIELYYLIVILDKIICILDHPFYMLIGGIIAYFTLKWSLMRNKGEFKDGKKTFWGDQKDEIAVTLVFGFIFIIWDDEVIGIYYDLVIKQSQVVHEFESYTYLIVGPIIERVYKVYQIIRDSK